MFHNILRNTNNHSQKKFVRLILVVLVMTPILLTIILWGIDSFPLLLICGLISFSFTVVLAILFGIYYFIWSSVYLRRHYNSLWKRTWHPSLKIRTEAIRHISLLDDPNLKKSGIGISGERIIPIFFMIWILFFITILLVYFFILS